MSSAGRPGLGFTEQQIRRAMSLTTSNRAAARILNTSLNSYRLYAKLYRDETTGMTLYDLHMNKAGRGTRKFTMDSKDTPLQDLLKNGVNITSYSIHKLKHRIIYEGLLPNCCSNCGFKDYRITDLKVPLLINYKDGVKANWNLENLELLCYNCYFLFVGEVFDDQQTRMIEDFAAPVIQNKEPDWDLDEYYRKHFEDIGLTSTGSLDDGSEFIARLK